MTCRVIADFNFKDGEIGKILGIGETHAKTNDHGPFVVQANFNYLNVSIVVTE